MLLLTKIKSWGLFIYCIDEWGYGLTDYMVITWDMRSKSELFFIFTVLHLKPKGFTASQNGGTYTCGLRKRPAANIYKGYLYSFWAHTISQQRDPVVILKRILKNYLTTEQNESIIVTSNVFVITYFKFDKI